MVKLLTVSVFRINQLNSEFFSKVFYLIADKHSISTGFFQRGDIMSIEAIGSAIQPAMIKGDVSQNMKSQDITIAHKQGAAPAELPSQSVKAVSQAEEEKKLKDAADKANDFVSSFNQELQFSVDKDTDKMVVKVVDKQNGDVIRQIPSKEMLEIAKALDTIHGLIIRKKV